MTEILELIDPAELRREVRGKYRKVAENPGGEYHFHTAKGSRDPSGLPGAASRSLPEEACEAFAGVANPLWGSPWRSERVADLGSGAGMDAFLAALWVGLEGHLIGVEMTPEMLERSRALATQLGLSNVEFREGFIENVPIEDDWAT